MMVKAIWKGRVIAESDQYEEVEGNIYFPPSALKKECFRESSQTSACPWKGTAHYYDIVVGGDVNFAAAWVYRNPSEAAKNIKDHVAFWRGVDVEKGT